MGIPQGLIPYSRLFPCSVRLIYKGKKVCHPVTILLPQRLNPLP